MTIHPGRRVGCTIEEIHQLSHIDPWFLQNIKEIVEMEMNWSRRVVWRHWCKVWDGSGAAAMSLSGGLAIIHPGMFMCRTTKAPFWAASLSMGFSHWMIGNHRKRW